MYQSSEINQIMAALAKAQGTYKILKSSEEGADGPFANLADILNATRESLSNNLLAFHQFTQLQDDGVIFLKSMLGHESGQYITSCVRIIPNKNERLTGSLIAIQRRIQASLLLGISPSVFDPMAKDDNGNALAEDALIETIRKPATEKKIDRREVITNEQYRDLMLELEGFEEIAEDIMHLYTIQTVADLPRSEFYKVRANILKIKKTHDEYIRNK